MKGKILFVAGLGVGYLLGTRAGRERYEQIKAVASKLWNDPTVQRQVDTVQGFVKDKAADVVELAADGAKKVVAQVTGRGEDAEAKAPPKTAPTRKAPAARKPAARKPAARKPAAGSDS